MTIPSGDTYQAEILRYVHDTYHGELIDAEIGVARRIWNEIGQRGGKNIASLTGSISILEQRGCIITDFGSRPGSGGHMRTSMLIMEEPPEGTTVHKPRKEYAVATDGDISQDALLTQLTAEEVAAALLKLAVEASQVPVRDINLLSHHIECLNEEIHAWEEVATELEAKTLDCTPLVELQAKITELTGELAGYKSQVATLRDEVNAANHEVEFQKGVISNLREVSAEMELQLKRARKALERRVEQARWRERALEAEQIASGLGEMVRKQDEQIVLLRKMANANAQEVTKLVIDAATRRQLESLLSQGGLRP